MKVKSESEVAQSCPTLCDPIDGNPPGFPVPGSLQARTLEWVAISFSEGGLVFPFLEEFPTVCCDPHKGFSIVSETEEDVFLEFSCFFYDQIDIGNLISGFLPFLNPA